MLTRPRLELFNRASPGLRLRRAALTAVAGDYPAALLVLEPETRLDRRAFTRLYRESYRAGVDWSRGELELFSAFTSLLNRCHF